MLMHSTQHPVMTSTTRAWAQLRSGGRLHSHTQSTVYHNAAIARNRQPPWQLAVDWTRWCLATISPPLMSSVDTTRSLCSATASRPVGRVACLRPATQSALGSIPRAKGTKHDDEKVEFIRQHGSASERISQRTNRWANCSVLQLHSAVSGPNQVGNGQPHEWWGAPSGM